MYIFTFFWSLLILASFWGFGEILRRVLRLKELEDIGWGLTMALGMAGMLFLGGVLMAFHLAFAPVLSLLVLAGASALLLIKLSDAQKKTPNSLQPNSPAPILDKVLYLLAGVAFASSIAWPFQIDPNDDIVCYLAFPEKILQTGTLIDTWNIRRIGSYGGQSFLQALVMVVGNERAGHVPDRGFASIILFGILLQLTRNTPKSFSILRFLLLACLFLVPVPRINTGSHLTGSALILALLAILDRLQLTKSLRWSNFMVPGILIAGIASLRMTYFLFAALTFASFFIFHNFFENKDILRSLQESVRPIFMGAISCFLALLPWMVVLYQSNQTPIFPLFLGTANPEFIQLGHKAGKIFDYFRAFAFFLSPEALVLLFFGILLPFARNRALCISAYAFSIIVSWLICVAFGVSIFSEYYRYTFPVLCSVAFWLAIQALNSSENLSEYPKVSIPAYFFTLTLIFLIGFHLQNGARELVAQVESLPFQYANTQPLLNSALTGSLKYLQKQTPVGSKIYAAVDAPYGFDFKRNDVQLADVPGGARIGEWPLKQGPEALRRYLLTQGFQFIMAVEFEKAMLLYTRKHWLEHQRPEWFFKEVWGKYFLDFMDSVDALAKDNRLIQTAGNVRLIDLRDKP